MYTLYIVRSGLLYEYTLNANKCSPYFPMNILSVEFRNTATARIQMKDTQQNCGIHGHLSRTKKLCTVIFFS